MKGRPRRLIVRLTEPEREELEQLRTGTDPKLAERAEILLRSDQGCSNAAIAEALHITKTKLNRILKKYTLSGVGGALSDRQRSGRPSVFTEPDKDFVKIIACIRPSRLPDAPQEEQWTLDSLTAYLNAKAKDLGHPQLSTITKTSVYNTLSRTELSVRLDMHEDESEHNPHTGCILCKRLEFICDSRQYNGHNVISIANDDANVDPAEIKSSFMFSLFIGLNLLDGTLYALPSTENNAQVFISFLRNLSADAPREQSKINLILDRHPTFTCQEVMDFLQSCEGRFNFIFNPHMGLVLNSLEKALSRLLRREVLQLKASSINELKIRINQLIKSINAIPAAERWNSDLTQALSMFVL